MKIVDKTTKAYSVAFDVPEGDVSFEVFREKGHWHASIGVGGPPMESSETTLTCKTQLKDGMALVMHGVAHKVLAVALSAYTDTGPDIDPLIELAYILGDELAADKLKEAGKKEGT
jgi:hypothetical protein